MRGRAWGLGGWFLDSASLRSGRFQIVWVFTQRLKQELYDIMCVFCVLLLKGFKRYHLEIQWKADTFSGDTGDV